MYDLLYIISKYYKKQQDDKVFNDEQTNKLCLICWLPSNKNETIQNMKTISHIVVICDCNPIFHKKCLDIWINKTSSCPICRKKITITSEIIITETTINKHIDILTYAIFIYTLHTVCPFIYIPAAKYKILMWDENSYTSEIWHSIFHLVVYSETHLFLLISPAQPYLT